MKEYIPQPCKVVLDGQNIDTTTTQIAQDFENLIFHKDRFFSIQAASGVGKTRFLEYLRDFLGSKGFYDLRNDGFESLGYEEGIYIFDGLDELPRENKGKLLNILIRLKQMNKSVLISCRKTYAETNWDILQLFEETIEIQKLSVSMVEKLLKENIDQYKKINNKVLEALRTPRNLVEYIDLCARKKGFYKVSNTLEILIKIIQVKLESKVNVFGDPDSIIRIYQNLALLMVSSNKDSISKDDYICFLNDYNFDLKNIVLTNEVVYEITKFQDIIRETNGEIEFVEKWIKEVLCTKELIIRKYDSINFYRLAFSKDFLSDSWFEILSLLIENSDLYKKQILEYFFRSRIYYEQDRLSTFLENQIVENSEDIKLLYKTIFNHFFYNCKWFAPNIEKSFENLNSSDLHELIEFVYAHFKKIQYNKEEFISNRIKLFNIFKSIMGFKNYCEKSMYLEIFDNTQIENAIIYLSNNNEIISFSFEIYLYLYGKSKGETLVNETFKTVDSYHIRSLIEVAADFDLSESIFWDIYSAFSISDFHYKDTSILNSSKNVNVGRYFLSWLNKNLTQISHYKFNSEKSAFLEYITSGKYDDEVIKIHESFLEIKSFEFYYNLEQNSLFYCLVNRIVQIYDTDILIKQINVTKNYENIEPYSRYIVIKLIEDNPKMMYEEMGHQEFYMFWARHYRFAYRNDIKSIDDLIAKKYPKEFEERIQNAKKIIEEKIDRTTNKELLYISKVYEAIEKQMPEYLIYEFWQGIKQFDDFGDKFTKAKKSIIVSHISSFISKFNLSDISSNIELNNDTFTIKNRIILYVYGINILYKLGANYKKYNNVNVVINAMKWHDMLSIDFSFSDADYETFYHFIMDKDNHVFVEWYQKNIFDILIERNMILKEFCIIKLLLESTTFNKKEITVSHLINRMQMFTEEQKLELFDIIKRSNINDESLIEKLSILSGDDITILHAFEKLKTVFCAKFKFKEGVYTPDNIEVEYQTKEYISVLSKISKEYADKVIEIFEYAIDKYIFDVDYSEYLNYILLFTKAYTLLNYYNLPSSYYDKIREVFYTKLKSFSLLSFYESLVSDILKDYSKDDFMKNILRINQLNRENYNHEEYILNNLQQFLEKVFNNDISDWLTSKAIDELMIKSGRQEKFYQILVQQKIHEILYFFGFTNNRSQAHREVQDYNNNKIDLVVNLGFQVVAIEIKLTSNKDSQPKFIKSYEKKLNKYIDDNKASFLIYVVINDVLKTKTGFENRINLIKTAYKDNEQITVVGIYSAAN